MTKMRFPRDSTVTASMTSVLTGPCGHHNDGRVFAQAPVRRYRVERADLRCAQARPSSVPLNCKKLGNVVDPASP